MECIEHVTKITTTCLNYSEAPFITNSFEYYTVGHTNFTLICSINTLPPLPPYASPIASTRGQQRSLCLLLKDQTTKLAAKLQHWWYANYSPCSYKDSHSQRKRKLIFAYSREYLYWCGHGLLILEIFGGMAVAINIGKNKRSEK